MSGGPPPGIVLEEASGELQGRAGRPRHRRVPGGGHGFRGFPGDTSSWRFGCYPAELRRIEADAATVFLYGWQDEDLLYARDAWETRS